jgi:AcrR family transcriptional regulator
MPFPSKIKASSLGRDALEVVEARGWDGWSLRNVASHLGVSVNALYRYVNSREDLVVAVGEEAAHELRAYLAKARGKGEARLIAMARRYIQFSISRPHAFSAFVHAKPQEDDPRIVAWRAVVQEVRKEVAVVLPDATSAAAFAYWAFIRGRAELARRQTSVGAPTAGLKEAVRALLLGYKHLGKVKSPFPRQVAKNWPAPDPIE